jgi:hypothetical protein
MHAAPPPTSPWERCRRWKYSIIRSSNVLLPLKQKSAENQPDRKAPLVKKIVSKISTNFGRQSSGFLAPIRINLQIHQP